MKNCVRTLKKSRTGLLFIVVALLLSPRVETREVASIQNLAIPEKLGKVSERFIGNSDRWIIQIQDVHAHLTAQENIAAIVDHLNDVYGINILAMEGGWSESTFPQSWGLPSSRSKQMLARSLLEDAHIGGPVYAALFSKLPMRIIGIEDIKLYNENLAVYLEHLDKREDIEYQLKIAYKELQGQKIDTFNPELLKFDQAVQKFRDGEKIEVFIPYLITHADSKGINYSSLRQISLFKQIMVKEKEIDKDKLKKESSRLMESNKNSRLTFEELLRSNKIDQERLQYYPQSKHYLELMKLQDKIIHQDFFLEVDEVIELVREKLTQNDEERNLSKKSKRQYLAKNIIMFKATPDILKEYEKHKKLIHHDMGQHYLQEALDLAIQFYDIAIKRDEIFYEKMMANPKLNGNIAMVTGGFHTNGLSRILRENGISYVVVTPELGKEEYDESLYFKRLQDPVPLTQTLAHEKNRYAFLDYHFPAAVAHLKRTNNILEATTRATRFEMRSGPSQGPVLGKVHKKLTYDKWMSMPDGKRRSQVRRLFSIATGQHGKASTAKQKTPPVSIVIRTSTLSKLLEDDIGRILWEEVIAPQSENRVVIIRDSDEFLDATIGISARVLRINRNMAIEDVLRTRLRNQKNIVIIDDEFTRDLTPRKVHILPEHPVALLFARLVFSPRYQMEMTDQLLNAFAEELMAIFKAEDMIRQYA